MDTIIAAPTLLALGGPHRVDTIIPTHDLVVVRLGHYAGAAQGERALARALALLMQAVPQSREVWQPPQE